MVFLAVSTSGANEFSADMLTKVDGQTMKGKIFIKGENSRVETEDSIVIYRQDKGVMWVLQPAEKIYMEMPLNMGQGMGQGMGPAPKTGIQMEGEVERKLIGKETVNGHPSEKYEVTAKHGTAKETFYQWIATDIDFPIKTQAADGSWSTEYKNIKKSVPGNILEIPPGYRKMSMPSFGR
jgi:hypothetical protein